MSAGRPVVQYRSRALGLRRQGMAHDSAAETLLANYQSVVDGNGAELQRVVAVEIYGAAGVASVQILSYVCKTAGNASII
jgi:hypothetical protein